MNNKLNIAPVISPDILKTISAATAIKTFGSQLKNKNKETVIIGDQTKTAQLDNELDALTIKEQQAGETQKATVEKAQKDFNTKQITQEEYNDIIISAQFAYEAEVASINVQRAKIQQDKQNITNDVNNNIKNQQNLFKKSIKDLKKKTQNSESKSTKDLTKQILSNLIKSLPPVIALQLVNKFSTVILQRKKLEDLVDQVNNYIDTQVKDEQTVAIATNLRNSAVTLIDNSVGKLEKLQKNLEGINKTITTSILIVSVIERILSLPLPFLLPIKVQYQPILQRILKLLAALGALLAIATILLSNEIIRVKELKDRLKEISLKLDGKTINNLNEQQLSNLINAFLPTGNEYPPYKGFRFKIKEEQDPRFVVKGNKRRYAVAINRDGVEQLKSEFSFTLDPNDLIEQLKLVIDQRNLQG